MDELYIWCLHCINGSLGLMLVSEHLVINVLSVVFSLTSRLILIFSEEHFALVNVGVVGLHVISGIILNCHGLEELLGLRERVLNSLHIHLDTTHDPLAFGTSDLVVECAILVEKEARDVDVLEVRYAFCGDDLHELASRMLYRKVLHNFSQFCSLDDANNAKIR